MEHSQQEPRFHALGKIEEDRLLHITFILCAAGTLICVISARDMHRKEKIAYQKIDVRDDLLLIQALADTARRPELGQWVFTQP